MQKLEGYDDALIGIHYDQWDSHAARLVYDTSKIVAKLVAEGMDEDSAYEYVEFNIIGAYVGPTTPLFVDPITMAEIDALDFAQA
jgi:hypothetical protein